MSVAPNPPPSCRLCCHCQLGCFCVLFCDCVGFTPRCRGQLRGLFLVFLQVVMGISSAMAFATRTWDHKNQLLGERAKKALDNANADSFTHMLDESLEL